MGSNKSGKAATVIYHVIASAEANQVEPFAYVREPLVQLSRQLREASALFPTPGWRPTKHSLADNGIHATPLCHCG